MASARDTKGLLWVDKHRPVSLSKLDFHHDLTASLRRLCSNGDLPHLLFYGPSGAGKRTRAFACLREIFGPAVEKLKAEHRVFKVGQGNKEVELTTVSSASHIEVNPSDAGQTNDRLVVQEIIKEIAASAPLEAGTLSRKSGFKVVVLHEVDQMSRLAQQALRRTMEKYTRTCRIIMITDSATKVIEPLRSRCLGIRVPLPSEEDVTGVLGTVARKEDIQLPAGFAQKLVTTSGRNLRKAVLQLEASKVAQYPFDPSQQVVEADWDIVCSEIACSLIAEQSPRRLMQVRQRFYELQTHAIPADIIFRRVACELLDKVDQDLAPAICKWAAFYEHRMQTASKPIIHLEAFAARFMQLYKEFMNAQMSMLDDDF